MKMVRFDWNTSNRTADGLENICAQKWVSIINWRGGPNSFSNRRTIESNFRSVRKQIISLQIPVIWRVLTSCARKSSSKNVCHRLCQIIQGSNIQKAQERGKIVSRYRYTRAPGQSGRRLLNHFDFGWNSMTVCHKARVRCWTVSNVVSWRLILSSVLLLYILREFCLTIET